MVINSHIRFLNLITAKNKLCHLLVLIAEILGQTREKNVAKLFEDFDRSSRI